MISLSASRMEGALSPKEIADLSTAFSRQHGVCLPNLLAAPLIEAVRTRCDSVRFEPRELEGLGTQLCCHDPVINMTLLVALNRHPFFSVLEDVTRRQPIRGLDGLVYRLVPGTDQQLRWHDDGNEPGRLLGFSLHLGGEPYQGGTFQLRRRGSQELSWEVGSADAGDAVVFDVGPALEHRITPLMGGTPRTVFAGWAVTEPALGPRVRG